MNKQSPVPLVIDLDGTLIFSDLLIESFFLLVRKNPLTALHAIVWFFKGKAFLKAEIAKRVEIDPVSLPYNQALIKYIEAARAEGRTTVLATASHISFARRVAEHLGIFDQVLATQDGKNLSGKAKQDALVDLFGENGFDYAGDGKVDLPVWKSASQALVVNASASTSALAQQYSAKEIGDSRPLSIKVLIKAIRMHQWSKNILVLIPLLLSHQLLSTGGWLDIGIAFIAFSLCASSVYLLNDMVDLPEDRLHRSKKNRPFASGNLSLKTGLFAIPILLSIVIALACFLPVEFAVCLFIYYISTLLYSFWFKRKAVIDVITLAFLYTSRIFAGAFAVSVPPSFWLLAFSMFLFLSLAIIKRYSELIVIQESGREKIAGRGYRPLDMPLLASLGASSGYVAVLVLALYVNSPEVRQLYQHPEILWLVCPLMLYWITRAWMFTNRGGMTDDPIVWAMRDHISQFTGVLICIIALFAL